MRTLLVLLLISMANLASADPLKLNDHLPEQTIGLLTITKMTQGQLLWLKGEWEKENIKPKMPKDKNVQ